MDINNMTAKEKLDAFEKEVGQIINKYSLENLCDTPDFILAKYLRIALLNFADHINQSNNWNKKSLN